MAGPGRVELKLEEDEGSEESLSEAPEQGVEELGLEEEESEENEVKLEATIEAPEEGGRKTFPLGEHEVEEVVVSGFCGFHKRLGGNRQNFHPVCPHFLVSHPFRQKWGLLPLLGAAGLDFQQEGSETTRNFRPSCGNTGV